jgi:hypothetical protein
MILCPLPGPLGIGWYDLHGCRRWTDGSGLEPLSWMTIQRIDDDPEAPEG